MEDKVAQGIAERVAGITKRNLEENVLQALSAYKAHIEKQRDEQWRMEINSLWSDSDNTVRTPGETRVKLRNWQRDREEQIHADAYRLGRSAAWRAGVDQGIKLGWAGKDIGEPLTEILKRAESLKPSH